MEQRSRIWFNARKGMITASRLRDITAAKGFGLTAYSYLDEILADLWVEESEESYVNEDMQRGIDLEPIAIERYEYETLQKVEPCGFIKYNDYFGGSPDGMVGSHGLIEVKCKNNKNHAKVLRTGKVPEEHLDQIYGCLLATDRQWCDFISYNKNFTFDKQIKIIRVEWDSEYIQFLIERINEFSKIIIKHR